MKLKENSNIYLLIHDLYTTDAIYKCFKNIDSQAVELFSLGLIWETNLKFSSK